MCVYTYKSFLVYVFLCACVYIYIYRETKKEIEYI